jgi:hypothetical protein
MGDRVTAGDSQAEMAAAIAEMRGRLQGFQAARAVDPPRPPSGAVGAQARRPPRRPPASQDDPLAAARRAIAAAEEEVRGVLADAREQLAEIGVRTREAIERLPAAPSGWAEDHVYAGTVSVACGPFADVEQLAAFAQALESVDGVGEVYTRSFEASDVLFEVTLTRPTVLLGQLRRQIEGPLTVVDGGDRHMRLEINCDPPSPAQPG